MVVEHWQRAVQEVEAALTLEVARSCLWLSEEAGVVREGIFR